MDITNYTIHSKYFKVPNAGGIKIGSQVAVRSILGFG
jgi:hypothetical protein